MEKWGLVPQSCTEGNYEIDVDGLWKPYYDRRRTENYTSDCHHKRVYASGSQSIWRIECVT
jgi:hypothetical protein